MSPEQAQGERVDQRSDLFSLGSVLYAMCTGRPPFRGDTGLAVLKRVCEDTPRPIREVNPDVPAALVAVVNRLLAKNPEVRFQTAGATAEQLSRYLAQLQHDPLAHSRRRGGRCRTSFAKTLPGKTGNRSTARRARACAGRC
jgi:serine/threonine-protein kinase